MVQGLSTSLQVCRTENGFETIRIHDVYRVCTRSSEVCRQVMTNILNPYADRDIIRISEVFVLRHIHGPHSRRMKNCPRVECRRVSISMGAIYKAAYGTLSRRENSFHAAYPSHILSHCLMSRTLPCVIIAVFSLHVRNVIFSVRHMYVRFDQRKIETLTT